MSGVRNVLEDIVGEGKVSDEEFVCLSYSKDSGPTESMKPEFVVKPTTTREVCRVMMLANKKNIPVFVRGGGTSVAGGGMALDGGILLDLTGMNKIISVDEAAMCVTVEAGITAGELIYELNRREYRLGMRGTYGGLSATIGGGVASNSEGYAAARYGHFGDNVLNIEVVLPTGEIVQTGSAANPNSSPFHRYCLGPDLTGLFLGDFGYYGIKTKITLRILRISEGRNYATYGFPDIDSASRAFCEIQKRQLPEDMVMYCDKHTLKGSLETPEGTNIGIRTVFEDESQKIADAKKELADGIVSSEDGMDLKNGAEHSRMLWEEKMMTGFPETANMGMWLHACHITKSSTIPWKVRKSIEAIDKWKLRNQKIDYLHFNEAVQLGQSAYSLILYYDENDPVSKQTALRFWHEEMMESALRDGGCPYWLGIEWWGHLVPIYNGNFLGLMKKIKKMLDPNNILNPGYFEALPRV